MPCWMAATGSLTSQDFSMDVVMQYKTIISTIIREEPVTFRSKSKIVGLRQLKLWKEQQWVGVPELNLRKADNYPCSILYFFLVLPKQEEQRNGSELFPEQNNSFFPICSKNMGHQTSTLCVQMLWEEENWENSSGPLLCCDNSLGIVQPCVSGVHLCSYHVTEQ